jgi:hypothetical protein
MALSLKLSIHLKDRPDKIREFPTSPDKNVVRYGAPESVACRDPKIGSLLRDLSPLLFVGEAAHSSREQH